MTFSEALDRLKAGERVARHLWQDDRHLEILRQHNGVGSILLRRAYAYGMPWQASDGDLLAEDWCVYEGPITNPGPRR